MLCRNVYGEVYVKLLRWSLLCTLVTQGKIRPRVSSMSIGHGSYQRHILAALDKMQRVPYVNIYRGR